MATKANARRSGFHAHVKGRFRLFVSVAAGGAAYPVLNALGLGTVLSLALAWDIVTAVFLSLTCAMMFGATPARIARRARELDIGLGEIVLVAIVAAGFSLFAAAGVLGEAREAPGMAAMLYSAAGIATIILSWFLVHALFSIHYAHEFYIEAAGREGKAAGGLRFPGERPPDYWDFVYFAAVVAMTSQVSDVAIDRREMRHLVTAHGVISFFLNTVIVALAVGIAAGLI